VPPTDSELGAGEFIGQWYLCYEVDTFRAQAVTWAGLRSELKYESHRGRQRR